MADQFDQSGIGQQQQAQLRLLSEQLQRGEISDAQYARRRKRIVAHAASLAAVSRGADGLVSTKALTVDRSYSPLLIKAGVAVVVLAVTAQIGWIVLDKYVINYEARLPEETPAVAGAPPVPTESDEGDDLDATIASLGGRARGVDLGDRPQSRATAAPTLQEADRAASEAADTEVPEVNATPLPDPEPEPAVVAPTPPPPPPPPPPKAEPVLVWDVDHPDHKLSDQHPYTQWCQLIKQVTHNNMKATIGVAAGPEVENFYDPAYAAYRDKLREDFEARLSRVESGLEFRSLPRPAPTGRAIADRMTGTNRATRDVAVLATTIQDGRAYAYYYAGKDFLLRQFNDTVGLAMLKMPEDETDAGDDAETDPDAATDTPIGG